MGRLLLLAATAGTALPWRVSELGRSGQSSWSTPRTLVYRYSVPFRTAWADLFANPASRPPMPAVDFSKYRVIIVAAGDRPSGGFRLVLDEAHVTADTALIAITEYTPAPGCSVTQEITTPAVAILVPNSPVAYRITTRARADTVRCN